MKINRLYTILVIMLCIPFFQGCTQQNKVNSSDGSIAVTPGSHIKSQSSEMSAVPSIKKVKVQPDKTYQEIVAGDPYSAISIMTLQTYQNIDRELFNYLYTAVKKQLSKADISSFKLTERQIMDTCESLYDRTGFELFYLARIKWSDDYKSVNFTYYDYTEEEIKNNLMLFYSGMNYLLNNVPLAQYSSIQKFFSIYEYITQNASYSYDITDEKTHSPYSILVNKMGICTGFSRLAHYVLSYADIPTLYIANTSHAWNMVDLLDSRFLTDFTWGAGYEDQSYLNTALMDDETRMEGLVNAGFGGEDIIVGYPRDNAKKPDACTDNRFEPLKDVYNNYGLDLENSYIYYLVDTTLFKMQMDGTYKEKILSKVSDFKIFQGVIYYRSEEDGGLYSLIPDATPSPIDKSIEAGFLNISNGILTYKTMDDTSVYKEINLNEFSNSKDTSANTAKPVNYQLENQASYQILLTFSTPMDTAVLPRANIGLVTEKDKIIPLHMNWNDTGYVLSLRPAAYINIDQTVTLYVNEGIKDINGSGTDTSYHLIIEPKQ